MIEPTAAALAAELLRACRALYLEVPPDVAGEVEQRARAVVELLEKPTIRPTTTERRAELLAVVDYLRRVSSWPFTVGVPENVRGMPEPLLAGDYALRMRNVNPSTVRILAGIVERELDDWTLVARVGDSAAVVITQGGATLTADVESTGQDDAVGIFAFEAPADGLWLMRGRYSYGPRSGWPGDEDDGPDYPAVFEPATWEHVALLLGPESDHNIAFAIDEQHDTARALTLAMHAQSCPVNAAAAVWIPESDTEETESARLVDDHALDNILALPCTCWKLADHDGKATATAKELAKTRENTGGNANG